MKAEADNDTSYPTYEDYKAEQENTHHERNRHRGRDQEMADDNRVRNLDDRELELALKRLDRDDANMDGNENGDSHREDDDSDSSSVVGPELPNAIQTQSKGAGAGPRAPTSQDLVLQQGLFFFPKVPDSKKISLPVSPPHSSKL